MNFVNEPFNVQHLYGVYVLSGTVVKTDSGYRPGSYTDKDHHGLSADGQTKCEAAGLLYKQNSNLNFVASGSVLPIIGETDLSSAPSYAEVYALELQKNGIPANQIIQSNKPIDSITELISLVQITADNNWTNVLIISNQSQIERVKILYDMVWNYPLPGSTTQTDLNRLSIMLFTNRILARNENIVTADYLKSLIKLRQRNFKAVITTSEGIIIQQNPETNELFEKIYKTMQMQQRFEMEKKGVKHIVDGTYYLD
ncbi:MAG: hypothetical protein OHK0017_01120 [Patescibacteria group bacterium]